MNTNSMSKLSETDWDRVDALTDETIDTSDIPPLTKALFARATLRPPRPAIAVTVHVDPEVWEWFKAQGGEYERRLSAGLRIYVEAHRAYGQ